MNWEILIIIIRLILAVSGVWVFSIVAREFWRLRNSHAIFYSCAIFFMVMLGGMIWLTALDAQSLYYGKTALRPAPTIFRACVVLAGMYLVFAFRLRP